MANRKRSVKMDKTTEPAIVKEKDILTEEIKDSKSEGVVEIKAPIVKKTEKVKEKTGPKYKVGSIVYISKEADADLNGFKLFPQYKKYTYTVEAYNGDTGVYSLRRLNLSLKLKEDLILAPNEKSDSPLMRRQF